MGKADDCPRLLIIRRLPTNQRKKLKYVEIDVKTQFTKELAK